MRRSTRRSESASPPRGDPRLPVPRVGPAVAAPRPDAVLPRPGAALPPGAALRFGAALRRLCAVLRLAAALPRPGPGAGVPPAAARQPDVALPPAVVRARCARVRLLHAAVRVRAPVLRRAAPPRTRRRSCLSGCALRGAADRQGAPCQSTASHPRGVLPQAPAAPAATDAAARGRALPLPVASCARPRSAAAAPGL